MASNDIKLTEADKEGQGLSPHWAKVAESTKLQHWDRMWILHREAWFIGNITKYVERYRNKNGMDDLKKATNYLNKLKELEAKAAQDPELAEKVRLHLREELLKKHEREPGGLAHGDVHLEGFDPDEDLRVKPIQESISVEDVINNDLPKE